MVVLGIETSCDETAAAVVQGGRVLSNIVSSSVPLHAKYGGVIPEIASRFHIEYINAVTKKALNAARKSPKDLELIAVTDKPGLPGSLIAGKAFARALSYALEVPLLGIDHLVAHLYANFLGKKPRPIKFPFVGAVVSGGHTNIFICRSFKDLEVIGRTRDDAIGEAFDKVSKILGLGYPGGPRIERSARGFGKKVGINFPRAYLSADSFDFSLSGIKTAVFYHTKGKKTPRGEIAKISWSFQEAVFDVLAERLLKACGRFKIKEVLLGGGVISNMRLRQKLTRALKKTGCRLFCPPATLCADNAAMVAGLGEALFVKKGRCKNGT